MFRLMSSSDVAIKFSKFVVNSLVNSRFYNFFIRLSALLLKISRNSKIIKIIKSVPINSPFTSINHKLGYIELSPIKLFALAYLLFIIIADYRLSPKALLFVFSAIAFFSVGFYISKNFNFRKNVLDNDAKKIGFLIYLISLLCLLVDLFYTHKIPVIDPIARKKLHVGLTYASTFIVLGGLLIASDIAKNNGKKAFTRLVALAVVTTFLVGLLGFRTQIAVSLISFVILLYLSRVIGIAEVAIGIGGVIALISIIGFFRAEKLGYSIAMIEVISKRAGLTLNIFDYIVSELTTAKSFLTGIYHGKISMATFSSFLGFVPGPRLGPRTIVAREFGVEGVTLTSTLLGTVALDLGYIGVMLFSCIIGFVTGLTYHGYMQSKSPVQAAFFSLIFAYVLTGIETGLVDFNVFVLFASAFVLGLSSAEVKR